MFIIDDIGLAPFRGFMFIATEVAKAAKQELENNRTNLMTELSSLHLRLEQGEITEKEFDDREQWLLDQLEAIDSQ